MEVKANAKINLCLDVVKKRDDGYHEMDMVMIPLALHDTIQISKSDSDILLCEQGNMPLHTSNTIVQALQLMRETYKINQCFRIVVKKRIPMEAGLAGGSADAAAMIRGINELMGLHIELEELAKLGKQIGADVPFCIYNECALVQGIGDKVTRFKSACEFQVLLVKPQEGVSTKEAFQLLDFTKCLHPNTKACTSYLKANQISSFYETSGNTLEQSAMKLVPSIQQIKSELEMLGFPFVLMSGSGSTVFALCEDQMLLKKGYEYMKDRYPFVEKTQTI